MKNKAYIELACSMIYIVNKSDEPFPSAYIKHNDLSWTALNRGRRSKAQKRNK